MTEVDIHLVPIGKIDNSILKYVTASVSGTFECPTSIGDSLPIPDGAYDPHGNRYSAIKILQNLEYDPSKRLLVIADLDLYIDKVKYLFGLAETPGQKGIVGIQRLRNPYDWSMLPSHQFLASIAKEAIHEIAHTFGLHHCSNSHCVMAFSRTLSDTYFKSMKFCGNCIMQLKALMQVPQQGGNGRELGKLGTAPIHMDGIPGVFTKDSVLPRRLR